MDEALERGDVVKSLDETGKELYFFPTTSIGDRDECSSAQLIQREKKLHHQHSRLCRI